MPISIFSISELVAYPIHQAVQSIGSTAEIKNSVAVVTGGASGIGRVFAEYWVKEGEK